MSTRSLLAVVPLKPRALMAHWRESTCATCRLEARRRASGRLDAPERRMSCWATPDRATQIRPNVKTSDVAAATVFMSAIGRYPPVYRGRGRRELFPNNLPFRHEAVVTHVTCLPSDHTTCRAARDELGRFCGTEGRFRGTRRPFKA